MQGRKALLKTHYLHKSTSQSVNNLQTLQVFLEGENKSNPLNAALEQCNKLVYSAARRRAAEAGPRHRPHVSSSPCSCAWNVSSFSACWNPKFFTRAGSSIWEVFPDCQSGVNMSLFIPKPPSDSDKHPLGEGGAIMELGCAAGVKLFYFQISDKGSMFLCCPLLDGQGTCHSPAHWGSTLLGSQLHQESSSYSDRLPKTWNHVPAPSTAMKGDSPKSPVFGKKQAERQLPGLISLSWLILIRFRILAIYYTTGVSTHLAGHSHVHHGEGP